MTQTDVLPPEPEPMHEVQVRLPLAKPRVTYVLLGLIILMFFIETVLGGSTSTSVLVNLGAQVNLLVWDGEVWRLLASMFLHIGVSHLLFNAWALYSLGRDAEAFYGSARFLAIYLVAGLFGGLAYYLLGPAESATGVSAGASGAIFGIIGAELAYWLRNRTLFGAFGRQRLLNLAVLAGINLVFGATIPGINNLAHLGGLVSGFLLAAALAPRYEVRLEWAGLSPAPRLVDRNPAWLQAIAVVIAILLGVVAFSLGGEKWAAFEPLLRR